jgi:hypothetical protein
VGGVIKRNKNTIVLVAALILVATLLISCSPPQLDSTPTMPLPTQPTTVRPEIPRVNPPQNMPDDFIYQNPGEQPHGKSPILLLNRTPHIDLDIPYADAIGKHHKILTQAEYPLLKHPPIRVDSTTLIGYVEILRFDFANNSTGKIVLMQDDTTEELGTFLLFEKDKPIFEYKLTLDRGTFRSIQGRDIQILGHTYKIAEVTNYSVAFFGTGVASNLYFENNSEIEVNRTKVYETRCKVTPNSISYTLYAKGDDDGRNILLSPKESLSMNTKKKALASELFDIVYKGSAAQNATHIIVHPTKNGYKLQLTTFKGTSEIPLVEYDAGRLLLGELDHQMRITPCPTKTPYCILEDSTIPLTSADGKTFLLKYDSAHVDPNKITFSDMNSNKYSYEFKGTPGKDAYVSIILEDKSFLVRIGPKNNATGKYNISVAQGYKSGVVEIVDTNKNAVRIGNITGMTLPIDIITAKRGVAAQERIRFNITYAAGTWAITVGNMTFYEDERSDDTYAASAQGTLVWLRRDKDGTPHNTGERIDILIPETKLYGTVTLNG